MFFCFFWLGNFLMNLRFRFTGRFINLSMLMAESLVSTDRIGVWHPGIFVLPSASHLSFLLVQAE